MASKTKSIYQHAKRRAEERYGINLSRDLYRQVSKMIQSGQSEFVEKQTLTRTVHYVELNGHRCKVVYSKKYRGVTTFLPGELHNEG
jgi:primosomal protein N''